MKAIHFYKEAIALNFLIKVVKLFYCVILVKVYIANNMYSCTNQGCRQSFKWRQLLVRHRVRCEKPFTEKEILDLLSFWHQFSCALSHSNSVKLF